jgi:m7GpppX diphosphatase
VLILEKTQFNGETVEKLICGNSQCALTLHNDIYKTFELCPLPQLNAIKTTMIYPATDKHIVKYSTQDICVIDETPEDYEKITRPYIESSAFSTKWVYNILEKKSEADRIVFEDSDPVTGFILLPDMKWDGNQVNDLYLVALVHDRSLRSLRDVRQSHLRLLVNIRDEGAAAIKKKYGLEKDQLRMYIHYQPSYYHLHVHLTNLRYDAPGIQVGKAHLLNDVIDNVTLMPDYYARKTMTYVLRKNEPLYELFQQSCGTSKEAAAKEL